MGVGTTARDENDRAGRELRGGRRPPRDDGDATGIMVT